MARALLITLLGLWALGATAAEDAPESPLDAENFKGPVCFISGSVKPVAKGEENAFTGMIRLRFESTDLSHCKFVVSRHCRIKWLKIGYVPEKIDGYFRMDVAAKAREEFTMTKNCSVTSKQPEAKP